MLKFKCQNKLKTQNSKIKTLVLSFSICFSVLFCYLSFFICHLCFGICDSLVYAQGDNNTQIAVASPQEENKQVVTSSQEESKPEAVTLQKEIKPTVTTPPEENKPPAARPQAIIVNGDNVEYMTESQEVNAVGNVEITYKDTKLTCQKIVVNTQTKEGVASGGVRLDEKQGTILGEKIIYNFGTKTGTIIDAQFRANPFFGKVKRLEKVNENEFDGFRGYATSCSFDRPHYRIAAKNVNIFPGDKLQTKDVILYLGPVPIMSMPRYNHDLKDPLMHVQLMPGSSKDWGPYMLSAWRFGLADNITGRIYLDYRTRMGIAEGFGTNYVSNFGKGDFKYYYTHEVNTRLPVSGPTEFQRYLIRLRHKWDIDEQTNLVAEYYKITDSKRALLGTDYNLLKDFFYREFEKDAQPISYALFHHGFKYSSLDFFVQKRTNRWYDPGYVEKLPEVKYSLPSFRLGESRFYFTNESSGGNYNRKNTSTSTPGTNNTSVATTDQHFNRLDTYNKFSYPTKVSFIQFAPFVADRTTFYSEGANGNISPRTIFYSGADLSTKFYRLFNVKTNIFRLNLNGLRHVITPTIAYNYNHEPTVSSNNIRQIDAVDSIAANNSVKLDLQNKLQTKRFGSSVDLVDFLVTTNYNFKTKAAPGSFQDVLFKLTFLPYSRLRFDTDALYTHSGNRDSELYNTFSDVNYGFTFDFKNDRSVSLSQRYLRNAGNQLTGSFNWRFNPKWRFSAYNRYEMGKDPSLKNGMIEQEYVLTRNLHCWDVDFTYNIKNNHGSTIMLVFRLKAFPEMEFNINQDIHQSESGSQTNK